MKLQHKNLAAGSWSKMPLVEQFANVDSEVSRAISWRKRGHKNYSRKAFQRALELLSFSKNRCKNESQLKEICRAYELLVDYFEEENVYKSTDNLWKKYFGHFTSLAAKKRFLKNKPV